MTKNYDDILHLSRPISAKHPHMSLIDRAAQFSPFAALVGYDAAVKETARLTNKRIELDEYEIDTLNKKLRLVADSIEERPEITITFFLPDEKKAGGAYVTVTGCVKKIDGFERVVCLTDGMKIPIEDILAVEGELLHESL